MIKITTQTIKDKFYEDHEQIISELDAERIIEKIQEILDNDLISETIEEYKEIQEDEAEIKKHEASE